MFRPFRMLGLGILAAALCGLPVAARSADEPSPGAPPKSAAAASPAAKPQAAKPQAAHPLSPEMAALRDQVRQTLGAIFQQPFNTRDNNVSDIIHFCRVFGCQSEVSGASGEKLNGITCLCWNLPCGGYQPLTLADGRLAARVGYGYQDVPAQLAAMLALSRVGADYPARADAHSVRTVADVIESEKLACRPGRDLSLPLIALAYYVKDATWKNSLGEEWSVGRMVREELKQCAGRLPQASATGLFAITWAIDERALQKLPLAGDLLAAKNYVDLCRDCAGEPKFRWQLEPGRRRRLLLSGLDGRRARLARAGPSQQAFAGSEDRPIGAVPQRTVKHAAIPGERAVVGEPGTSPRS